MAIVNTSFMLIRVMHLTGMLSQRRIPSVINVLLPELVFALSTKIAGQGPETSTNMNAYSLVVQYFEHDSRCSKRQPERLRISLQFGNFAT